MSEELRRLGAQTREELLDEYGLVEREVDGVKSVVWKEEERGDVAEFMFVLRPECERLLRDCLREVGDGLVAYSRDGVRDDDDTDYISALADQAQSLARMLTCDNLTVEPSVIEDRVLKILNSRDVFDASGEPDDDVQPWIYGYADHYSPMSSMRRDEDA